MRTCHGDHVAGAVNVETIMQRELAILINVALRINDSAKPNDDCVHDAGWLMLFSMVTPQLR